MGKETGHATTLSLWVGLFLGHKILLKIISETCEIISFTKDGYQIQKREKILPRDSLVKIPSQCSQGARKLEHLCIRAQERQEEGASATALWDVCVFRLWKQFGISRKIRSGQYSFLNLFPGNLIK